MVKLYAYGAAFALAAAMLYGVFHYGRVVERAHNAEQVAALQSDLAALGLVIQKLESEAADTTRKLEIAERERVDAIRTTDHKTAEIIRLEKMLERERGRSGVPDKSDDIPRYRIIIPASTVRVWEQARSSDRLPESESASVLQKRLPEVTGDDINAAIKYAVYRYNGCAIRYNELWRSCDRIINQCQQGLPQ